MAVMDVHHPNILEFINCKARKGSINILNISVGTSDEFVQAVCGLKKRNRMRWASLKILQI